MQEQQLTQASPSTLDLDSQICSGLCTSAIWWLKRRWPGSWQGCWRINTGRHSSLHEEHQLQLRQPGRHRGMPIRHNSQADLLRTCSAWVIDKLACPRARPPLLPALSKVCCAELQMAGANALAISGALAAVSGRTQEVKLFALRPLKHQVRLFRDAQAEGLQCLSGAARKGCRQPECHPDMQASCKLPPGLPETLTTLACAFAGPQRLAVQYSDGRVGLWDVLCEQVRMFTATVV